LFKKFDEGRNDYEGDFSKVETLKEWVDEKSFATVMKFDDRAVEKVFQQGKPTIFLFSEETESSKEAEKVFSEVAHLKKGKILFSLSKASDGTGYF